jgi:hypothetical protein
VGYIPREAKMLHTALLLISVAHADDEGATVGDLSYEGNLSEVASSYTVGKPVSVTHSGGNVSVRCVDTDKLSGRLPYTITGTAEGAMESAGKGMGLKVSGDGKGGGVVSTRVSGRNSGISSVDAPLTVNIPAGIIALSISQSGSGWVQVIGCSGALKVSAGAGGLFASGTYTSVNVSASGGDVKVKIDGDTALTGASSLTAKGGNVSLTLPSAQGGKLNAKGTQVMVQQAVLGGSQTESAVSGDFGIGGPAISVSASGNVEIGSR